MKRWIIIVFLVLPLLVQAQTTAPQDSTVWRKPDAVKAVWLGVIFPGAGQIYNRSYWKLPIVYGAFMGCGYAVDRMQNRYNGYKLAYVDIYNDIQNGTVTEDPSKSYIAVLPDGYTLSNVGGASTWMNTLKNRQSVYRRYRDYSILATVVVYALSLVDAYVDAQLFDYDISPDLSIHMEPQIYIDSWHQQSAELKLAIQF